MELIAEFLDHLEHERGNAVTTRNARLAAIRSLFRFAALRHPEHAATIQQVLAIPPKRCDRTLITYLTHPEIDALLTAPDATTWTGRRDHALLTLAIQTGLRISELIGLRPADLQLGTGPHVACWGKGRKQRITPLTRHTIAALRAWLSERAGQPDDPLFSTSRGQRLSRTQTLACGLIHLDTRGDLPMDVNARGLFYRAVASVVGIRGVAIARAGFVPTHISPDGIAHGPATQTAKWNEPPVPNPIIRDLPDCSFRRVRVGAGDYETRQYPSEARGKEIEAQGGAMA